MIEVLISAMHQKDFSLFEKMGIETDALMIDQCDEEFYKEEQRSFGKLRLFGTKERGLSRSRNRAVDEAIGNICLFADDDERLEKGYSEIIERAYLEHPNADIICFKISGVKKKYSHKEEKIGYLKSLRIGSCQITFKKKSVWDSGVRFDVNYGSGTEIGSGEENIFLFDCLKKKLKIYYVPLLIGTVKQTESRWFKGFNEQYFLNRGKIIRRLMGKILGVGYSMYFVLTKRRLYKEELSTLDATKTIFKGLFAGV